MIKTHARIQSRQERPVDWSEKVFMQPKLDGATLCNI